jgi:hypothetical protein
MKDKKPFKETRVGLFLERIAKGKLAKSLPELVTGDVLGFVKGLLKDSDELTEAQRNYALKLIELDIEDMKGVTGRWQADMSSDSWLSKNVRPLMLIFLTVFMAIAMILDSSTLGVEVDSGWIDLLKSLLMTAFVAYFGGRSFEKTKRL